MALRAVPMHVRGIASRAPRLRAAPKPRRAPETSRSLPGGPRQLSRSWAHEAVLVAGTHLMRGFSHPSRMAGVSLAVLALGPWLYLRPMKTA